VHVAFVTTKFASKPATSCIEGSVPHLGLIVAEFKGQTSPGEAEVHAKNNLVSLNDLPHGYCIVSKSTGVMAFFRIGPLQRVIDLDPYNVPSLLYISKVPQKAKDVLVEPVLLLIDSINFLEIVVPAVHVPHASSPAFGGKVALTNTKSPDVQEVESGSVCANDFVDTITKKIKQ
jgi:hypothetical protein